MWGFMCANGALGRDAGYVVILGTVLSPYGVRIEAREHSC